MAGTVIPPDKIPRDTAGKPVALRSPGLYKGSAISPTASGAFANTLRLAAARSDSGIWPVQGPITSAFGPRNAPGLEGFHTGIDIAVPEGSPVTATADGVVSSAGEEGGYGLAVHIDHGAGVETLYGHNSMLLVSPGQRVRAGQVIALSGNTGHSTGPHLHFEVRIDGRPVDPTPYLQGRASLPGTGTELPFGSLIASTAFRYGLDPALLAAVAKAESGFNPWAVSRAGAKGLMQLMDSTAAAMGVSDPFDPFQNLDGGARYLRSLLDRFGDPLMALAAYNAGPGAVERYGGIPPFAETRRYLASVLRYWQDLAST
jgi:hypothetical protein